MCLLRIALCVDFSRNNPSDIYFMYQPLLPKSFFKKHAISTTTKLNE